MKEFRCTLCGACCRNVRILLLPDDIARLSEARSLSPEKFIAEYTDLHLFECEQNGGKLIYLTAPVLRMDDNGACVFLRDNRCTVYDHRPVQCRHLPFITHPILFPDTPHNISAQCPAAELLDTDIRKKLLLRTDSDFSKVLDTYRSLLKRRQYDLDTLLSADLPAPRLVTFEACEKLTENGRKTHSYS